MHHLVDLLGRLFKRFSWFPDSSRPAVLDVTGGEDVQKVEPRVRLAKVGRSPHTRHLYQCEHWNRKIADCRKAYSSYMMSLVAMEQCTVLCIPPRNQHNT